MYLKCVQALELTEIDISKGLKSVNFSIVFWLGRFLAKFSKIPVQDSIKILLGTS